MRIRKAFATAAVLAAALGPVLTASTASAGISPPPHNNWACYGYGTGATYQEAKTEAQQDMIGNRTIGAWVYTSGQNADGSYWVKISADCTFVE
ncbi:hypothetical protein Caci_4283 [Catenulispora acidiphila DSM 44928]|uniref:Uncharacterized protein n=1 Tax=Catenulispora acidiphila (strain DSM 44928 / JCM 14897 / NBRC 102108 / NRRL B-24433 / ID139908) TaxID=479433 RepID=C7QJQ9_CATAD|nr:hypothetical protein [Catenulispora acidiphila]ACU73147.1 hypothetical protein Caci_4283 [Catenulispora acidiphila DSM 44928]